MAKAQLTKWSKWYLLKSEGLWVIRRYRKVNGKTKWQRLNAKSYAQMRGDEAALKRKVMKPITSQAS